MTSFPKLPLGAFALLVVGGITQFAQVRRAEACSPALNCPTLVFPSKGATNVPLDTHIWADYAPNLVLSEKGSQAAVATTRQTFSAHDIGAALKPNTEYVGTLAATDECEAVEFSFTTGTTSSATPLSPTVTKEVEFADARNGNTCWEAADQFRVRAIVTADVENAVTYRLYRVGAGDRKLVDQSSSEPLQDIFLGSEIDQTYQVVAVSANGEESATPTSFEVNEHSGGGCQSSSGAPVWMVLGVLGALFARRRW